MRLVCFLILISLSIGVHAKVFKLAVITSEFDNDVTDYYLETNDQNRIVNMRYVITMPNGGIFNDVTLPAERVVDEGAVLVQRNGYEAVRLEVENFSLETGGIIKLNYLYNGITGARHNKRLYLHQTDGQFSLFELDSDPVNRMFLEANILRLVGIVGVRSVHTSFSGL
jgi:hypothetical protein